MRRFFIGGAARGTIQRSSAETTRRASAGRAGFVCSAFLVVVSGLILDTGYDVFLR